MKGYNKINDERMEEAQIEASHFSRYTPILNGQECMMADCDVRQNVAATAENLTCSLQTGPREHASWDSQAQNEIQCYGGYLRSSFKILGGIRPIYSPIAGSLDMKINLRVSQIHGIFYQNYEVLKKHPEMCRYFNRLIMRQFNCYFISQIFRS